VAEYRMVLYSLLLIVLMLARPQGLFNFDYEDRIPASAQAPARGAPD
jgi:ABC-type branched-subunit amino acid transport system permease subunit